MNFPLFKGAMLFSKVETLEYSRLLHLGFLLKSSDLVSVISPLRPHNSVSKKIGFKGHCGFFSIIVTSGVVSG